MQHARVYRWLLGSVLAGGGLFAHVSAEAKTMNVFLTKSGCATSPVTALAYGYLSVGGQWTFDCGRETTGAGTTQSNTACNSGDNAVRARVTDSGSGGTSKQSNITGPWTAAPVSGTINCSGGGTAYTTAWGS